MSSYKFGKIQQNQKNKIYFKISYAQKDEAKLNNYKWDAEKKSWYKLFDEEINFNDNEYKLCEILNTKEIIDNFENHKDNKINK
jgi:hypothetical protein